MTGGTGSERLTVERVADGQVLVLRLDAPKANIIDAAMVAAIRREVAAARTVPELRAVVFVGAGPHFSFGASVQEHRPGEVAAMLRGFHAMFEELAELSAFLLAAVRGQCLGGGLELAAYCHRVFAAPDAHLGQPEIRLGVIAPVASVILADRTGRGAAEDLCCSGRIVSAAEALRVGLVDEVVEDPYEAALAYATTNLLPLSGSSLRHAVRAARLDFDRRFRERIRETEQYYLDELMASEDAVEGIEAFLAKRPPEWRHR